MLDTYYMNTQESIDYSHSRDGKPGRVDFHLHNRFEIYYLISGDVNYFIEKTVYRLKPGDLLVINSNEIHKPYFLSDRPYERIVIHFDSSLPLSLSSPDFNLLNCFLNRPKGEKNRISLSSGQNDELMQLFMKLENLSGENGNGAETLKLAYFCEILVKLNRIFVQAGHSGMQSSIAPKLPPILEYIDRNLGSDLSLESLEQRFYINRFYLSRLFKKSIGSSIHEYIILKRISKAKKLLSEGLSVTETCSACGFNDYSNFLRMFRRTVGVSPGRYRKNRI